MSFEGENGNGAIAEWQAKRETEIAERDAADAEAKKELKEEAVKHIDDFYDNYNRKKAQQLEDVRKEAEEFQKSRDEFSSQEGTTTWDRVLQLINEDDADQVAGRDKSKFKEILQRLKGNAAAPGA
ncbi:CLC1 (YGR167W) [Zygosaccharomyces parabailii]|uniref:Clathrin light chain n=1 Tax=Zygosaccharomyces bailii (strain CLIB 213 / ATCC 58445 / CBS 680 / BCRC 21525 / NBRC 1098 / NCYC 1416 / NRRL Y-2227) TaxID=1333698 RepID=A0A8J2T185_ZYGB2|nr:CLC1 (YGR167W) [Zygosaccharomyces parabailii]CDF87914.1 BN860_17348g1_1 [Zygosaccharomyces bailii CLIB 213]CDH17970.1 related to Clathrin light chain [Zygosaccharomyces bailii ISA1307]SJM83759.1 related to Clathrin light chain [Zygosaccharomyces bailii]